VTAQRYQSMAPQRNTARMWRIYRPTPSGLLEFLPPHDQWDAQLLSTNLSIYANARAAKVLNPPLTCTNESGFKVEAQLFRLPNVEPWGKDSKKREKLRDDSFLTPPVAVARTYEVFHNPQEGSISLSLFLLNFMIGQQRPTTATFRAHKCLPNSIQLIPHTGDAFTLKVTNHGEDSVFVAVLFFAGDGSCSCVYPPGGKAAKAIELKPGQSIMTMPNRIFVPPTALSIYYVDNQFVDTLAVYITRKAVDYTTLLDEEGLKKPGSRRSLRGGNYL